MSAIFTFSQHYPADTSQYVQKHCLDEKRREREWNVQHILLSTRKPVLKSVAKVLEAPSSARELAINADKYK